MPGKPIWARKTRSPIHINNWAIQNNNPSPRVTIKATRATSEMRRIVFIKHSFCLLILPILLAGALVMSPMHLVSSRGHRLPRLLTGRRFALLPSYDQQGQHSSEKREEGRAQK